MAISTSSISSPGIGSGLDVASIVSKLMQVEQQPLDDLNTRESAIQAKVSAMGTIKSALSTFQTSLQALSDTSKFMTARVTSADTSILSATGSASATNGSYSLEVTKLAKAQKLVAAGQADTAAPLSTGTITIDFGTIDASGGSFDATTGKYTNSTFTSSGSGAKTIVIDSSNNTLAGVRDAINKADVGVIATIVNDGSASPYRLVLTNNSTGKAGSMKISVSDPGSLQDLLAHDPASDAGQALSETSAAQNAELKIDGIPATKSSNAISDLIPGVTLNLLKTNSGAPTTVTVDRDTTNVTTMVNSFVTSYNALTKKISDLTAYDATTKKAGVLNGDSAVRSIQSQITSMLTAPLNDYTNGYTMLSEIGVTKQRDGTLAVDATKLQAAMTSKLSSVMSVFAAVGISSDSQVSYLDSTDKTKAGAFPVKVTTLPAQGSLAADGAPGSLAIDGTNDTIALQLNGTSASITLASGTYGSLAELAAEVQSKINGNSTFTSAGQSVTVDTSGGLLKLVSTRWGASSAIRLTGGTGASNLFGAAPVTADGADAAGTINGAAATGAGQYLTGATGDDSEGLRIKVSGGATGARGTVSFTKGYAYQLNSLITSFLADDGTLTSRTDGLNTQIKNLENDKTRLQDRLTVIEQRYRDQFTALDNLMSSMTKTSSFLTQQIAALSKNS
ncbi:flagellar filament capping protein FliD [Noviherbaspirillum galbum]|uniref:Flagellar hook-associated protein 2 n=1 Tax=Noviherbaspirillum galbum TaxID=2709383 RepID=A0A6B3STM3_9BURK|nr:flagellar filament capping protein FliD [Noviherbaspirillum galbum]NEX62705.1 flagellar filament capping protein FliD [Noviherbaspirillum galbum]